MVYDVLQPFSVYKLYSLSIAERPPSPTLTALPTRGMSRDNSAFDIVISKIRCSGYSLRPHHQFQGFNLTSVRAPPQPREPRAGANPFLLASCESRIVDLSLPSRIYHIVTFPSLQLMKQPSMSIVQVPSAAYQQVFLGRLPVIANHCLTL